jgi:hypothetical protein
MRDIKFSEGFCRKCNQVVSAHELFANAGMCTYCNAMGARKRNKCQDPSPKNFCSMNNKGECVLPDSWEGTCEHMNDKKLKQREV